MDRLQQIQGDFNSLSEFVLGTDVLGWESDFRQLDTVDGKSSFILAGSPVVKIMHVSFVNRVHQIAVPERESVTFGVITHQQAPGKIGNRVLDTDSLLYIDPYHGLDAVIEPDFSGYTLTFDREHIGRLAETLELADPTVKNAGAGSERFAGVARIARLRIVLRQIISLAMSGDATLESLEKLEWELPVLLLETWSDGSAKSVPARSRMRALNRALDYLGSCPRQPTSVEALCLASACSMSTLERAFVEQFGLTPKKYISRMRLSHVRKVLLETGADRSVTEIANEWGYHHMGKFAADYRLLFGELPSVTANSARASSPLIVSRKH